jgi:UDP-2,3-diacylglucosamine pyrophosphatase LpxH
MSSAENIGVVSDIHLGFSDAQVDAFSAFLDLPETRKLKKLILLGDILDFWVADDKTIFENVHHILRKIEVSTARKFW